MGRIGEPEEIADVIVFLASNTARYMTGRWSWWTADCWLGGTGPGACAPPLPSTISPMGDGASALTDRSCCTTFKSPDTLLTPDHQAHQSRSTKIRSDS